MDYLKGILNNKQYKYEVILCRPDRTPLCYIPYSSLSYSPKFRNFNTLDISINRIISNPITQEQIINPAWELIQADYLVYFEVKDGEETISREYFVLESPSEEGNGEQDAKSYSCGALERKYWNFKILEGFKERVKLLYDPSDSIDPSDGLPMGLLNYILKRSFHAWNVGYWDSRLNDIYRVFTYSDSTVTNIFKSLETLYGCIITFDSYNMLININLAELRALGENRGLVISNTNMIANISYSENTEGVASHLYVSGKNNATIAKYNPTGQRFAFNYDFFLPYMSDGLREAVKQFNQLVESKTGLFEYYVDRLDAGDTSVIPLIEELQRELSYEENFSVDQLKELSYFIREANVTVNEISDEKQLYDYALRRLKSLAFPQISVNIDSIDLFSIKDYEGDWIKLSNVGDFCNILYEPLNLNYLEMRLIGYTHNPIENTLSLEFSNADELELRNILDFKFYNTFNDISSTYQAEVDSYRQFNRESDNFIKLNSAINTGTTNILNNNIIWNSNGFTANVYIGNVLSNKIYINYADGFKITHFTGGVDEVPILSLNRTNGNLIIDRNYVEGLE